MKTNDIAKKIAGAVAQSLGATRSTLAVAVNYDEVMSTVTIEVIRHLEPLLAEKDKREKTGENNEYANN